MNQDRKYKIQLLQDLAAGRETDLTKEFQNSDRAGKIGRFIPQYMPLNLAYLIIYGGWSFARPGGETSGIAEAFINKTDKTVLQLIPSMVDDIQNRLIDCPDFPHAAANTIQDIETAHADTLRRFLGHMYTEPTPEYFSTIKALAA